MTGGFNGSFLNTAELFAPTAATFTLTTGNMVEARQGHTATLLQDGKVLIAGGINNSNSSLVGVTYLKSAEIYDPSTGNFTSTGAMSVARSGHTATLLPNGKVLIAGGSDGKTPLSSAELFDPATGKFTATQSMTAARTAHTASRLVDGRILLAGGQSDHSLSGAEIYDPASSSFTAVSSTMTNPRSRHSATILENGSVLLAGGQNSPLLVFDTNSEPSDNVAPNIVFSADSEIGFVSYTGSGTVVAFSPRTGAVLGKIGTGGYPTYITPLPDGKRLAVVSAFDNRIFIVGVDTLALQATYSFQGAEFGFGSALTISPDGSSGYISSSGTGEVIKLDMRTGQELGRLKNLMTPAQITLTADGGTLMVADTSAEELIFANASAMTALSTKVDPKTSLPAADLTIFTKAVLSSDGVSGLIAVGDVFGTATDSAVIFRTSTGEIATTEAIGISPMFTTLSPDGLNWIILSRSALSTVPTSDPDSTRILAPVAFSSTGSASTAVSFDSRYAFYPASDNDLVFQHDLITTGVVGQTKTGDSPDLSPDQPSTIAITPDGSAIVALNFKSNELDLLTDAFVLSQSKFVSQQDQFTGITLINLSDQATTLTLTAYSDSGLVYTPAGAVNPVRMQLEPNAQVSLELGRLFNFDNTQGNLGWLSVMADQPAVAGFATIGRIHPSWLGAYLDRLDGVPMFREPLHDWIVPEVVQQTGSSVELNFVNPNFNATTYVLTRYSPDGTVIQTESPSTTFGSNRAVRQVNNLFTVPLSGRVLVVGGEDSTATTNTVDAFDPSGQTFTASGALTTPRQGHAAALLQNGKVLVSGGKSGASILNTAETYDTSTGRFTATSGAMQHERFRHTATVLHSGKILLAGGQNSVSVNDSAELYDPITDSFFATASSMTSARDAHTATLLSDGSVLLTGGLNGDAVTATTELFDPATSSFAATQPMSVARAFHSAVALNSGQVLIAGGFNGEYLDSAELYDPPTGSFVSTSRMTVPRSGHTATLLEDGRVLIVGGTNSNGTLSSAEIFDPLTGTFASAGDMTTERTEHTATLLPNGRVLIAGGTDGSTVLNSAELYDPANQTFATVTGTMTAARKGHTATFLVAGAEGYLRVTSGAGHAFTEIFNMGKTGAALNGINAEKYAGVTKLYSAQFAITPSFQTSLNLINANADNDATVTITLHGPDGAVLSTPVTRQLARNAQFKDDLWTIFKNDPSLENTTGWIEITSSVDRLVGTITFTDPDGLFTAAFEFSGVPSDHFLFPMAAEDAIYQTAIALLNSGNEQANVQLELWGEDGTLDRSSSITLAPGSRTALYLADYFPGLEPRLVGNIRIRSDRPLHGFSILNDRDLNFLCAIPPIPFPAP